MNLTEGILRCRYRDSWERPSPMVPGEVYAIDDRAVPDRQPVQPRATGCGSTSRAATSRISTSIRIRASPRARWSIRASPATASLSTRRTPRILCCRSSRRRRERERCEAVALLSAALIAGGSAAAAAAGSGNADPRSPSLPAAGRAGKDPGKGGRARLRRHIGVPDGRHLRRQGERPRLLERALQGRQKLCRSDRARCRRLSSSIAGFCRPTARNASRNSERWLGHQRSGWRQTEYQRPRFSSRHFGSEQSFLRIAAEAVGSEGGGGVELEHAAKRDQQGGQNSWSHQRVSSSSQPDMTTGFSARARRNCKPPAEAASRRFCKTPGSM